MKQKFIDKRFSPKSEAMIEIANKILAEYEAEGYDLSLRQLYYQMVARDIIPNSVKSYNNLGSLISDGRKAGLIDWNMICDRGRVVVKNSHWETPADILDTAAETFQIEKWKMQPSHVVVMVEKQALEGVLIPVCERLDVPFLANKGYSSDSTMYRIARKMRAASQAGKEIVVIYLGDHDPSGIDMTRDVKERLELYGRIDIDVQRVALNMDQIRRLNPPENPAKQTDSRFDSYRRRFGNSSWELDAIEPTQLAEIVSTAIISNMDSLQWERAKQIEDAMKSDLAKMAADYRNKRKKKS